MNKMPISQIVFGKTDAFNELNTFGQDYFMGSFVSNPKYHIDEFLSGSRYYICGKKGTGKSALLKYLQCCFEADNSNLVFPIRFKSDIEQVDKDSFELIAAQPESILTEDKYDTASIIDQASYVLVWKTFLINQIITRASAGEFCVFKETNDYRLLVSLLKCIYGESTSPSIVMPKIKKGSVEITATFAQSLSADIKIELEFDSKKKRIKDELRLSYSEDEVNSIFTLLNRITMPFSYDSLTERIQMLGKFYPNIPALLNNAKLTEILNKLYALGVIGNTGKPMNFVFLNKPALDLLGMMVIHTPLRNYFAVQYER